MTIFMEGGGGDDDDDDNDALKQIISVPKGLLSEIPKHSQETNDQQVKFLTPLTTKTSTNLT